jgi:hypothetical protein
MQWLSLCLFIAIPLLGWFAAWQSRALLTGRPALLSKRLSHLPADRRGQAQREFGYLLMAVAVCLIALPAVALALRWAYPTLSNAFQIIGAVAVVWAWLLNRRHKLSSK